MKKLLLLLPLILLVFTASAFGTDRLVPSVYPTIQDAVTAAVPGDNIIIAAGTHSGILTSGVIIDKANLTIQGAGNTLTIIQVSGLGDRLDIAADGVTIKDLQIEKTDKTGEQNIIRIRANNVTIKNNIIWGKFVIGDGEVSRAMVFNAGGYSGLQIEGNTIHALRQPAYISGTNTGNIITNYTYNTKGWVLEGGNLTFSNNTWGTGVIANVYDVAILSACPSSYYTDIVAMSNANNGAVIEDQRVSPAVLSVVYVDASTSFSSDLGGRYHPYSTITPAITRVVNGGKINVAAGIYLEDIDVTKSITLLGAGMNTTILKGPKTGAVNTIKLSANNIFLDGFTITRDGNNVTDWNTNTKNQGVHLQSITGCTVQNCKVTGNRTGIYVNDAQGNTIKNNIITFNRTGLQLVNNISNCLIEQNDITDNWTVGFVIYYASAGLPASTNVILRNNNISGNWYGEVNSKTSQPNPTTVYNFSSNWYGTNVPVITSTAAGEPGYAGQIPVLYGGTATNPGTNLGEINGDLVALVDYSPYLNSGTDTQPGVNGFQGDFSNLWVSAVSPQTGATGNIQEAVTLVSGSTINLTAGTYIESGQLDINKNVTIQGVSAATTIIIPGSNTTVGGNVKSESFIYVDPVATVLLKNFTVDCAGKQVNHAIQSRGSLTVENCVIKNVKYGTYNGRGIVFYKGTVNSVKNTTFTNIERIGIHIRGNVEATNPIVAVENITYTGKGVGNWLDYGVEFGGGGKGTVANATITECKGVASDFSTSAGILVTDYWGTGTEATITGSTLINNSTGIAVGYGVADNSVCVVHNNNISNNTSFGISSTHPVVNATANWWGTALGPYHLTLNPTGTGNAVTDYVNFVPWTGSIETHNVTNANLNLPVNFTGCNTTMTFTSLPPGTNANVSVQRIESSNPPTGVPGYPHSAGNGLPLYLMITATGLTNYTFSVTVVVDVSNINGFNPNTEVMYFSTASNSWVGIEGVYSPSAKTFTFTTDHFTPFGFVNPTNPNDIYLSQVALDPVNTQKWYPSVGMGDPAPSPDWKYSNAHATFYVVPTGTTGMFSSKFAVVWDKSKANLTITAGDYWDNQMFYSKDSSVGNNGRYWINVASQDLTNQVPGSGKYLAKLEFTNIKPGYIPVSVDGTDFRYYYSDGDSTSGVYITTHPGKILFYLGDVGKTGDETIGDAKINFEDLTLFSASYWSISPATEYKFKYDIGPTNVNGSYWALPNPDGRIEFEDLNIFAIGYGKTGAGQLPDYPGDNKMKVSTLAGKYENGYYKVPVKVSGVVRDFRTGSFEFGYSNSELEFAGFEKKGGFEGDDNFMLSRTENNKIMLDAAIVGAEKDGMSGEQVIMNLLFTEKQQGTHNVSIISARARYSSNTPINVTVDGNGMSSSELPTVFSLEQNYPNPFNPVTTIKYGLPKDVRVSIVIYDVLGREVITLANDYQKAGYHQVEFRGDRLASGTYFYRLIAGDFTSIKKMVLIK